jgi:translation elongation factor EF-Tu-like GTPase
LRSVSAEDAVDQRDWNRVEQELGELVSKVDVPLDQQPAPARSSLANRGLSSGEDSTEAILEQIAKALESDGIVSRKSP